MSRCERLETERENSMQRCQRCQSTMLLDYGDTMDAYQPLWKCMGCGRETFHDATRQQEENAQFANVLREQAIRLHP